MSKRIDPKEATGLNWLMKGFERVKELHPDVARVEVSFGPEGQPRVRYVRGSGVTAAVKKARKA